MRSSTPSRPSPGDVPATGSPSRRATRCGWSPRICRPPSTTVPTSPPARPSKGGAARRAGDRRGGHGHRPLDRSRLGFARARSARAGRGRRAGGGAGWNVDGEPGAFAAVGRDLGVDVDALPALLRRAAGGRVAVGEAVRRRPTDPRRAGAAGRGDGRRRQPADAAEQLSPRRRGRPPRPGRATVHAWDRLAQ